MPSYNHKGLNNDNKQMPIIKNREVNNRVSQVII